jgi:hypothetical protein
MSTESIYEVTLHDFLPGKTSFPPGPARARARAQNCPDIRYIYQEDSMLQPAPYWVCISYVDNAMKDITMMSAIRKLDAARPFTKAIVMHTPPAQVLSSPAWTPIIYMSMEGLNWYSIRIEQWHLTERGLMVAKLKCDEKITLKPLAYRGQNYFALNGVDPMVSEDCGGNGAHAFKSSDPSNLNPPWQHWYDLGFKWEIPAQPISEEQRARANAEQIAAGAPVQAV